MWRHSMLWTSTEIFVFVIVISVLKLPFFKSCRDRVSKSSPTFVHKEQKAGLNKVNVDISAGNPNGIDRSNKL